MRIRSNFDQNPTAGFVGDFPNETSGLFTEFYFKSDNFSMIFQGWLQTILLKKKYQSKGHIRQQTI